MLLGLAAAGLTLAQAAMVARILAGAAAGAGPALGPGLALLLVVVFARAAAVHGGEVTALCAAADVKERLRSRLLRHVLDLGPAWIGGQRAGEITALATGGLDALDPYFARYLPQAFLAVAVPAAVLATVSAADWISGVIIAVTLPLIPLFAALVGLHTKARTRQNWLLLARLSGHFLDVVQGLPTLKVLGRAKAQEQVIGRITSDYRASAMSTLRVAFLSALVLELSAALATALVAVEVGLRLLYGHIDYSTALLVLLLTPEAYLPLRNASAQFHASADGTTAAGRVFEILDVPVPPGPAAADRCAAPDLRTDFITFNKVTVAYPGRAAPVLDQVSLTICPGERVTLTGPNGAGKTTLLNVLLRFTKPASGSVRVGGVDLADWPADSWRAQIGWLPQRPWLFPWSVAENIALGARAASRAAVERAAGLAGAADFIEALPDGYDTLLDERALRLSAGQRQKIALARLFLRDAPLVLIDEPTAHLDPVSAAEIELAIGALTAGRTVIAVSHRSLPARQPGRILEVRDGTITESVARPESSTQPSPVALTSQKAQPGIAAPPGPAAQPCSTAQPSPAAPTGSAVPAGDVAVADQMDLLSLVPIEPAAEPKSEVR